MNESSKDVGNGTGADGADADIDRENIIDTNLVEEVKLESTGVVELGDDGKPKPKPLPQTPREMYEYAKELKDEGNVMFRTKQYKEAIKKYVKV